MILHKLVIEHPRPSRSPVVATLHGTPVEVKTKAVAVLKGFAARLGVSPLALDWELQGVKA